MFRDSFIDFAGIDIVQEKVNISKTLCGTITLRLFKTNFATVKNYHHIVARRPGDNLHWISQFRHIM